MRSTPTVNSLCSASARSERRAASGASPLPNSEGVAKAVPVPRRRPASAALPVIACRRPGAGSHGAARPAAAMPAGAKLVSSATLERRSKTVTAWPSPASACAAATPAMPAPITAIFIGPSGERRGRQWKWCRAACGLLYSLGFSG